MCTHNTTHISLFPSAGEQHKPILRRNQLGTHRRVTYGWRLCPLEGGETCSTGSSSQSVALITGEGTGPSNSLTVTLHLSIWWSLQHWGTTLSCAIEKRHLNPQPYCVSFSTFTSYTIHQQDVSSITTASVTAKSVCTGVLATTIHNSTFIYICISQWDNVMVVFTIAVYSAEFKTFRTGTCTSIMGVIAHRLAFSVTIITIQ